MRLRILSLRLLFPLCGLFFTTITAATTTDYQDNLPNIGTTTNTILSLNQEQLLGDITLRKMRRSMPLINDPLLLEYINQLGSRLVKQIKPTHSPIHLYLLKSHDINAFAFFGNNIVLFTQLFKVTDTESQLASVIAHEISHITQRHLARMLEQQRRHAPLAVAGILGSLLLSIADPQAGLAGLTGTLASQQQSRISYTQENEWEADRIGIKLLTAAGFDPQGMPEFMQKMVDIQLYSTKLPEILFTHPFAESRLADSRSRAALFPTKLVESSLSYYLAKTRIIIMYSASHSANLAAFITQLQKGNTQAQQAAKYGQALLYYQEKKYLLAKKQLLPLLEKDKHNSWYLDLITDIDLAQSHYNEAILRLETALKLTPKNTVLQINLANSYLQAKRFNDARKLLNHYTHQHPQDLNGWELLMHANSMQHKKAPALAAKAELEALQGKFDEAIALLSQASQEATLDNLSRARYDARLDQMNQLKHRLQQAAKIFN